MAVRRMIFGAFRLEIKGLTLVGELRGERVDPSRHAPACEPKGATCTELRVHRSSAGEWIARCVVDV
jgi:SHS2 domain-containing protein